MRDYRKSTVKRSSLGWLLPLAFLALPDCSFDGRPQPDPNLDRGDAPHRAVLFCDIEQRQAHPRRCATDVDLALGTRLESAALSLTRDTNQYVALDYRPQAAAESGLSCSPGTPVAITFYDPFPRGTPLCLNASQVLGPGHTYADANAACLAACLDKFGSYDNGTFLPDNPPTWGNVIYCSQYARASTNVGQPWVNFAFLGACTEAGAVRADFVDPRRVPEAVHWRDKIGTKTSGSASNTLYRTAAETGEFDAGAASVQSITQGDAYVEFTATETATARALGLSVGAASSATPDADPTIAGIGYAVRLGLLGNIDIQEGGVDVPPPGPGGFGQYSAGDHIRIALKDNLDGTASISYYWIPAACSSSPSCTGTLLRSGAGPAPYPFRADASIRTQNATLGDIEMVRIKPF